MPSLSLVLESHEPNAEKQTHWHATLLRGIRQVDAAIFVDCSQLLNKSDIYCCLCYRKHNPTTNSIIISMELLVQYLLHTILNQERITIDIHC